MKVILKLTSLILMTLSASAIYVQNVGAAGLNRPEDAVIKHCALLKGYKMDFKTTGFSKERKAFLKYANKKWGTQSDKPDSKSILSDIGIDKFDLNEDGKHENFFYWYNSFFCNGQGRCKLMIFDSDLKPLEPDSDGGLVHDDILILEDKINSYRSIAIGGVKSLYNIAEWNGKHYQYAHTVLLTKDGCINGDGEFFDFYLTNQPLITDSPRISERVLDYLNNKYKGHDIKKSDFVIDAVERDLNDDGQKATLVKVSVQIFDQEHDPSRRTSMFKTFILVFDDKFNLILPLDATDIIILNETIDSHHSIAILNDRGIAEWSGWQVFKWSGGKYTRQN